MKNLTIDLLGGTCFKIYEIYRAKREVFRDLEQNCLYKRPVWLFLRDFLVIDNQDGISRVKKSFLLFQELKQDTLFLTFCPVNQGRPNAHVLSKEIDYVRRVRFL